MASITGWLGGAAIAVVMSATAPALAGDVDLADLNTVVGAFNTVCP